MEAVRPELALVLSPSISPIISKTNPHLSYLRRFLEELDKPVTLKALCKSFNAVQICKKLHNFLWPEGQCYRPECAPVEFHEPSSLQVAQAEFLEDSFSIFQANKQNTQWKSISLVFGLWCYSWSCPGRRNLQKCLETLAGAECKTGQGDFLL